MQIRRTNTEPLKNGIRRYLDSIGATQKIKEIKLKNSWLEIMPTNIIQATEGTYIKNSKLHVKLSNSIVKHEILMRKTSIIEKLNKQANENIINDIIIL